MRHSLSVLVRCPAGQCLSSPCQVFVEGELIVATTAPLRQKATPLPGGGRILAPHPLHVRFFAPNIEKGQTYPPLDVKGLKSFQLQGLYPMPEVLPLDLWELGHSPPL
jgi:hypothetical protein